MQRKTPKKQKKLTAKEKLIINNYQPDLTTCQNLQKLEDKGLTSVSYGYQRLRKSQLLSEKIDAIHAHWDEMITRELVPTALSNIKTRLKGKRVRLDDFGKPVKGDNGKALIEVVDTFRDDKLVLDTYVKRNEQPQVQVNMVQIERLQAIVGMRPAEKTGLVVTMDDTDVT